MVKTGREIKEIIQKFQREVSNLGITTQQIILFGSYATGTPREDSDIDLIVIADDFGRMNIRERLELLGIAAGRVFEPIEAPGYTTEELEEGRNETFLGSILQSAQHMPADPSI
jgi:predicted nucleotidyltransferase